MSLIIPATIGNNLRRIALYEVNTTAYPYFHELLSFGPVKISPKTNFGGYWKPSFGSAEIVASAFDSQLPPDNINLPTYLMTSAGNVFISDIVGQLTEIKAASASYDLYGQEFTETTNTGSTTGNDTLIDYFAWACDSSRLNLSLDSSLATNCDIDFTLSDERQIIDVLDDIAESTNHGFYIDESDNLYLIDLAKDNGSIELVAKYDFFDEDVKYSAPTPYSIFKAGNYSVTGSYPSGKEYNQSDIYQTVQADIEEQLSRKKALADKWWIEIVLPIGDNTIRYGQKITFLDESKFVPINVTMWARDFHYTLNTAQEKLTIAGEGTLL